METYFCPSCGSPAVDTSVLMSEATCRMCGWSGPGRQLVVSVTADTPGQLSQDQDAAIRAFVTDFSLEFSKTCGVHVAKILLKWGFLPPMAERPTMVALLNRYMRAIALAACQAIIRERELIAKEAHERKTNAS